MERGEKAAGLFHHDGNNCCQAVLLAFADRVNMAPEELKPFGAAFGGGMGCMEGTCGALCGAEIILGLAKSADGPVRKEAAALLNTFAEQCGSSICKVIKGVGTGKVLCSCPDCVKNAADILEGILNPPDGE